MPAGGTCGEFPPTADVHTSPPVAPAKRPDASVVVRVGGWLRLAAAVVLLLLSALVVVPAPTNRAWLLALGLGEFGHWLAPVSLLLLWPGWHRTVNARIGAACGVIAAACFLTPLVRALPIARVLPLRLVDQFGPAAARPRAESDASPRPRPIDPLALFGGIGLPAIDVATIAYAQRGARVLSLDLYRHPRPADAPPAPAVIVVHGGGWQSGSRTDLPELNAYLAARGFLVAVPEYRLAPDDPFPAAFDDLRAAIDFVRGRARQWGADGDGVVLIGRSAGAQLALLAAYTAEVNAVRGVVSIYGPADLQFAWEHPGNPRVYDGLGALERYLGGPPSAAGAAYRDASPYHLVGERTPPTLLIHGRRDDVVRVEQSRRLDARLAEAGRRHMLLELPWARHGCDFTLAGPCGQLSVYAIERFLAAVTAH